MKYYSAHDIQNKTYDKVYQKVKDNDYMSGKKSTKADIQFSIAMSIAYDLSDILNTTPDKLKEVIENIRKKY